MKYPWANVLILFLAGVGMATGFLGLLSDGSLTVVSLWVHRISGYALIFLLAWKLQNILQPILDRQLWRYSPILHLASIGLLLLLFTALALGAVWSTTGYFTFWGISGVSWHIYVALLLLPLLLVHLRRHRRMLRPRYWAERRTLLRTAGLAVAGFVLWRAVEVMADGLDLPGQDRRFTGSYERGSFSGNDFPSTSWLNDKTPRVDSSQWHLQVRGRVTQPLTYSYDELMEMEASMEATLDCTGGWYSTQEWQGASLKDILDKAGPTSDAASITVRSLTGYYRRFSLGEAEDYMLAVRVGGEVLEPRHGFPARLVSPGKRGYDWVKWVDYIEVNNTSKWWQPPLPIT